MDDPTIEIKEASHAADEAADLLTLIEAAAASITEVTADDRGGVIKGFRRAEAICGVARMASKRLEVTQEWLTNTIYDQGNAEEASK